MERYFSTGQSPQRAVAPTEEEEEGGLMLFIFAIQSGRMLFIFAVQGGPTLFIFAIQSGRMFLCSVYRVVSLQARIGDVDVYHR
jgi:hypothetical protein